MSIIQDGYKQDSGKYKGQVEDYNEDAKEYIKLVNGEQWKFVVKPSGYCHLYKKRELHGKKWWSQLHAVDVSSALQYIYEHYRLKEPLVFEELEDFNEPQA